MTTPRDDLQDFLDGTDPLNELYAQREQIEPPAELDAAILSAARDHAKRPARPRWLVPVSLAATVVLGTGLAVKQLSSPMRSFSESAIQETLTQNDGASEAAEQNVMADDAVEPAAIAKPSMADIPVIEAKTEMTPAPVDVETRGLEPADIELGQVDMKQARERARRSIAQTTPEPAADALAEALPKTERIEPPAPAPVTESLPAPAPASAPELRASTPTEDVWAQRPPAVAAGARPASDLEQNREREEAARLARRLRQTPQFEQQMANPALSNFAKPMPGDSLEEGLGRVVNALRAERDAEALARFQLLFIRSNEVRDQLDKDEQSEDVPEDVVTSALARVRTLHADGDIETAQKLLDVMLVYYPNTELPADLPLGPSPPP